MIYQITTVLFCAMVFLFQMRADASGEHHHRFGDGKALQVVDKHRGFKLSPEAMQTLEIELRAINMQNPRIPQSSFVSIKDKKGFYILRDGFFKFFERGEKSKLMPEDQVVVKGMGFIAIADVYSKDESEYGHSH